MIKRKLKFRKIYLPIYTKPNELQMSELVYQ